MQVLPISACCSIPSSNLPSSSLSRRELFFDGVSSVYSSSSSSPRSDDCGCRNLDFDDAIRSNSTSITRRALLRNFGVFAYFLPNYFPAYALGDPSVMIEEVTPPVFTSGPLLPSEVGFPRYHNFNFSCLNCSKWCPFTLDV